MLIMENKIQDHAQPNKEHLKVLKDYFDHNAFFGEQWSAISSLIYGKDVVIHARSGFGKSLIYQYPPVFLGKKALVISPIISLMETQVQMLKERGISAISISGQQKNISFDLKKYKVIYSTPENFALIKGIVKWAADGDELCLIAVDEAHCISKFSSDHRAAYSSLKNLGEMFSKVPIVTLTSTASSDTLSDISKMLGLRNPLIIKTPLDRPNIQYISAIKSNCFITDVKQYLLDLSKKDAVIIYVYKRADTEHFADTLSREGFNAKPYHSGLVEEVRRETLNDFMTGRLNFLVTTNAFGMGVDRSNVRVVIHYGIPKNPDTYYMESGRAGRDGKPSKSIIYWSDKDYKFHQYCFKENLKKKVLSHRDYVHISALLSKIQEYTVSKKCRRGILMEYLGEKTPTIVTDHCCDNCLEKLHKEVGIAKMYKEVNSDDALDITTDVRMVLNLVNSYQGKCKNEFLVDFITGKMPTEFNPLHPVEYFACGIKKPKSWWLHIIKIIKEKHFIERHTVVRNTNNFIDMLAGIARDDYIRTTKRGLTFIRGKSKTFITPPKTELFHSLTKTDIEYYIENGEIKQRPRDGAITDDGDTFDLTALSTQLINKSISPKKRLASDSDYSDISLGELFRSPKSDLESSSVERSPKVQRTCDSHDISDGQPGCSHWCASKIHSNTEVMQANGSATQDKIDDPMNGNNHSGLKVPLLKKTTPSEAVL